MQKLLLYFPLICTLHLGAQEISNISGPFSKSVLAASLLFISGQTGMELETGNVNITSFENEAKKAIDNFGEVLKYEGLDFRDLINTNIYLKVMKWYETANLVYRSYFNNRYPARVCIAVCDLPSRDNVKISGVAKMPAPNTDSNKLIIQRFLDDVRSGKFPDKANLYMADTVLAHQMNAENESIVKRSPEDYAEHIRDFLKMYGNFSFEVTELIAENDKVYVRWKQTGKHLGEIEGHPPTGKPLIEIASAVYKLQNGKIVEYWIQIDRFGFEKQLESK